MNNRDFQYPATIKDFKVFFHDNGGKLGFRLMDSQGEYHFWVFESNSDPALDTLFRALESLRDRSPGE